MDFVWMVLNIETMKQNVNWEAVLEELKYELRQKMKLRRQCDVDDERNPYDFAIMDLQEQIGLVERGQYEEAYKLLVAEWGEEFFDDYLEKTIYIDGIEYKIVQSEIINPFDRMAAVKPGEAVRYYHEYMYRTPAGEARMCDAGCTSNNCVV